MVHSVTSWKTAFQEGFVSVARCLVVLLGVVSIVGCARIGASAVRASAGPLPSAAEEELALLRLVDRVEAAALASR